MGGSPGVTIGGFGGPMGAPWGPWGHLGPLGAPKSSAPGGHSSQGRNFSPNFGLFHDFWYKIWNFPIFWVIFCIKKLSWSYRDPSRKIRGVLKPLELVSKVQKLNSGTISGQFWLKLGGGGVRVPEPARSLEGLRVKG